MAKKRRSVRKAPASAGSPNPTSSSSEEGRKSVKDELPPDSVRASLAPADVALQQQVVELVKNIPPGDPRWESLSHELVQLCSTTFDERKRDTGAAARARYASSKLFELGIPDILVSRLSTVCASTVHPHPRDPLALVEFFAHLALEGHAAADKLASRFNGVRAREWKDRQQRAASTSASDSTSRGTSGPTAPTRVRVRVARSGSDTSRPSATSDSDFDETGASDEEHSATCTSEHEEEMVDLETFGNFVGIFQGGGGAPVGGWGEDVHSSGLGTQYHFLSSPSAPPSIRDVHQRIARLSALGDMDPRSRLAHIISGTTGESMTPHGVRGPPGRSLSASRWPTVGDNVLALYFGGHERFDGRYCEAHVVSNNGDGTFLLQWRDGDDQGRVVNGDPAVGHIKLRGVRSEARLREMHGVMMKRAIPDNALPILTLLVGDGVDVNYVDSPLGHTPLTLSVACKCSHDFCKYLLDVGAELEKPGPFGTPLQMLVRSRTDDLDLLHLFLGRGADITALDTELLNTTTESIRDAVASYASMKLVLFKSSVRLGVNPLDQVPPGNAASTHVLFTPDVEDVEQDTVIPAKHRLQFIHALLNRLVTLLPGVALASTKGEKLSVAAPVDDTGSPDASIASTSSSTTDLNIYKRNRLLKLITYIISNYPSDEEDDSFENRPSCHSMVPLFDLIENVSDGTDISFLLKLLAAAGQTVYRFNEFSYLASWFGVRDLAKRLSKESNLSSLVWEFDHSTDGGGDSRRCAQIAAKVVQQISSAKSKISSARSKLTSAVKGHQDDGKGSKGATKRKRSPTRTPGEESPAASGAADSPAPSSKALKSIRLVQFAKENFARNDAVQTVLTRLTSPDCFIGPFVALLKGELIDLPLTLKKFNEFNFSSVLVNSVFCREGKALQLFSMLAKPGNVKPRGGGLTSPALSRFLRLLRSTAIQSDALYVRYFRRLSGQRVTLRNLIQPIELKIRRSPKCAEETVSDLCAESGRSDISGQEHTPTGSLGNFICQPMLDASTLERRVLGLVRLVDPRYLVYCSNLVGCTVEIEWCGRLSEQRPSAPTDGRDIMVMAFVQSFDDTNGTHAVVVERRGAKVVHHILIHLFQYTIRKDRSTPYEEYESSRASSEKKVAADVVAKKRAGEASKEAELESSSPGAHSFVPLRAGDRVSSRYRGGSAFYNGRVRRVHPDESVSIDFDDGDRDQVPLEHVRRLGNTSDLRLGMRVEVWARKDGQAIGSSSNSRWTTGVVVGISDSAGAGMVDVRINIMGGDEQQLAFPSSLVRVPMTSTRTTPLGTRVLAREQSGTGAGSTWKLGTVVNSRWKSKPHANLSSDRPKPILSSHGGNGQVVYDIAMDSGVVLSGLKTHEFKLSSSRYRPRYGGASISTSDEVAVAEANQAFPGLDMGRTGKPGRINPEEALTGVHAADSTGPKAPLAKETAGGAIAELDAQPPCLKRPHIITSWHIDPLSPVVEGSDQTSAIFSRDFHGGHPDPPSPLRTSSRSKKLSFAAIQRIREVNFHEQSGVDHPNMSTQPKGLTLFGALHTLLSLQDGGETHGRHGKTTCSSGREHELVAPWGLTYGLCYNVVLDMGDGAGPTILPSSKLFHAQAAQLDRSNLESMDYADLQELAKEEGIRANQKKEKLLKLLRKKFADREKAGPNENPASDGDTSECHIAKKGKHEQGIAKPVIANFATLKEGRENELLLFGNDESFRHASKMLEKCEFSKESVNALRILQLVHHFILSPTFKDSLNAAIRLSGTPRGDNNTISSPKLFALYKNDFVSPKLVHVLNEQLKKPLAVAGNAMAPWCSALVYSAPFLLTTAMRIQWHSLTSQGISRCIECLQRNNKYLSSARAAVAEAERAHNAAMMSSNELQQVQAASMAAQAAERLHEAENKHNVGALRCDIAKVRRGDSSLLKHAEYLVNVHSVSTNKLEVQFLGENGFGDGVTQGFYSEIAKTLQKRAINKATPMWAVDTNEDDGTLSNKYGLIPKPFPQFQSALNGRRENDVSASVEDLRLAVLKRFKFLGCVMAKALLDSCIVPLPLTTEFFALVRGDKLPPNAIKIVEGDHGYMSGLLKVVHAMESFDKMDTTPASSASALTKMTGSEMFLTMSGNDLCSTFGANFFTKRSTRNGRKEYVSIDQWLAEMDLRYVDPTLTSGTFGKIQVANMRRNHTSGFNFQSRAEDLRKRIFAAQKAGDMKLVRELMLEATKKPRSSPTPGADSGNVDRGRLASSKKKKRRHSSIVATPGLAASPNGERSLRDSPRGSGQGGRSAFGLSSKQQTESVGKRRRVQVGDKVGGDMTRIQSKQNGEQTAVPFDEDIENVDLQPVESPAKVETVSSNLLGFDELIPNGAEIRVKSTLSSLKRFTSLIADRWLEKGIAEQIAAFREGISEVFPVASLSIFSALELRTLFCGEPKVDWTEETLRSEILLVGQSDDMTQDSEVFKLLVKELVQMSNRERARFLEFVTAIPRLTPGMKISVSYQRTGRLPTARTCTYDLFLPAYRTQDALKAGIREAVANGLKAGFHEGDGNNLLITSPRPSPMITPSIAMGGENMPELSPLPPPLTGGSLNTGMQPLALDDEAVDGDSAAVALPNGAEYPGFSLSFDSTDIGAIISVYWTGPQIVSPRWFQGVVNHYDGEKGHYVIYPEDNDMQWHDLRQTRYRLLAPIPNPSPATVAVPETDATTTSS